MKRLLLLSSLLCLSHGLIACENNEQEPTKEQVMQYLQEVSNIATGFDHSFYIFKPQNESNDWQEFVKSADNFKHKINTSAHMDSALLDEGMNLLKSAIAMGFVMQPSIDLIMQELDLETISCKNTQAAEIVVLSFDLFKNTKISQEWFNFVVRSVDHAQQILGDESLPEQWLSIISTFIDTNLNNAAITPKISIIFLDAESLKE
ncbi:MAG: hypothetical protein ACOYT8_04385 [Candidatus Dependentiae bacterium]